MSFLQDLISGSNNPAQGSFDFKSSDHIRYQNGMDVSGHNYGCHRTVRIEKNISGNRGYTVTIFNDDSIHPVWGNNVQMSSKPMEVVRATSNEVILQGYGYDQNAVRMGVPVEVASFKDYAITLNISFGEIDSCVLHMLDRGVDLVYFK